MIDFDLIDHQEATSITALNLNAYLRRTGWEYQGKRGSYAEIFTLTTEERKATVAVPAFELLDDHAERVADAVEIISRAEARRAATVYRDLMKADNDRVRINSTNGARHVPLTIGNSVGILEAGYDLMSYSARAAEAAKARRIRAAFRGGISAQVSSYLNSLTFSPDFLQGYHLTMYSPVSVELDHCQEPTDNSPEIPFAREATQTLAQALTATAEALSASVRDQSHEHFKGTTDRGVSANLCDALARLAQGGQGISIDINWSLLRGSSPPPQSVAITYQHADILRSAADTLRTSEPSLDELVFCHVIRLERGPEDFDGRATLLAIRDGKAVKMSALFNSGDYTTVIEAFSSQQPLSLIGDIHQTPGGLELRNPRSPQLSV